MGSGRRLGLLQAKPWPSVKSQQPVLCTADVPASMGTGNHEQALETAAVSPRRC